MPTKTATSKRTPTKKAGTPAATQTSAGAAAAAPADVASDYLPDLALSLLEKNPNNPRHRAVANAELVESIRIHGVLEPVIVAPHATKAGRYVLIAGHRRVDGSKKANRKTIRALVRRDLVTDAEQLEAMLIENLHRENLSPIEEAEGYHQLELFGYRQHAIAKAMGVSIDTVRARLNLLKLSPTTIKKVQSGDLTLTDASTLVEFAGDPEVTRELEKAAKGDPVSFKRALTEARRVRDTNRRIASEVAKLLEHGATEVEIGKGESIYQLDRPNADQIDRTHSKDWGQHNGCLGFVRTDTTYQGPALHILCLDVAKHAKAIQAERVEQQEKNQRHWEDDRRARETASLAKAVAADMRIDTVIGVVADVAAPPTPVTDVIRTLLPILVHDLMDRELTAYQRAIGIKDEDRWGRVLYQDAKKIDRLRFAEHVDELRDSPALATRAMVAYLVVKADHKLGSNYSVSHQLQLDYLDLLSAVGHAGDQAIDGELRREHEAALPGAKAAAS